MRLFSAALVLVLAAAGGLAWAADGSGLPNLTGTEGAATLIAAVIWGLIGLWNRRGTKVVENKTDDQTKLLNETLGAVNRVATGMVDLHGEIRDLRQVQEETDQATTIELAQHGEALQSLKAGQAQQSVIIADQGRRIVDHGHRISALADGLARVQTVVNLRGTDRAMADGLAPAPPIPPKE